MTGVLAIGRHAGPFLSQPTHVVHVDAVLARDRVALHDTLVEQLGMQGPLLVVYPSAMDPDMAHALATLRAAMDQPPLLWHATDLPPLAADVLVTLAAALWVPGWQCGRRRRCV